MRFLRAAAKALAAFARLCDEQRKTLRIRRQAMIRHLAQTGGASSPGLDLEHHSGKLPNSRKRRLADEEDPFADLVETGAKLSEDYAALAKASEADLPQEMRDALAGGPTARPAPSSPSPPPEHAGEAQAPPEAASSPEPLAPAWHVVPTPPAGNTRRATAWANILAADPRREAHAAPPAE